LWHPGYPALSLSEWPGNETPVTSTASWLISAAAGLLPALKAARMPPTQALWSF
jgi:ABC-type lipoprotein release transport system permease subunit